MKLLSLLIPTYNRLNLTKSLVLNLSDQIKKNGVGDLVEIIVCDNSTNLAEKIELSDLINTLDDYVRFYNTGENIGPTENWIRCIENADSEYSLFIFSDDYFFPDGLSILINSVSKNNIDVLFVKAQIEKGGHLFEYLNFADFEKYRIRDLLFLFLTSESLPVSPGCAVLRTDVLKALNFDQILSNYPAAKLMGAGSDAFMIYSCLARAERVNFLNNNVVVLRDHEESYTGNANSKKAVMRSIAILKLNLLRVEFGLIYYFYYFIRKQFNLTIIRMRIKLWGNL